MRRSRIDHWEIAAVLVTALLGTWLARPGQGVAAGAAVAALVLAALAGRTRRPGPLLVAVVAVAGAVAALMVSRRVERVERDWPAVREAFIQGASARLSTTLEGAVSTVRDLATLGAGTGQLAEPVAFERLNAALLAPGPERGVVVLDSLGRPWAWAGRHRLAPSIGAAELYARITPFYVILEARRQVNGHSAVAHVALAADSAVRDAPQTVAAQFAQATGVRLEFYPPGVAPHRNDVFDYCIPSCSAPGGADTLFSVRTVPPGQGEAKLNTQADGGRVVAWLLALSILVLGVVGGSLIRRLDVGLALLLGILTPLPERLGIHQTFASTTFFLHTLGPVTASAGALILTATFVLWIVAALPDRPVRPRWAAFLVAGALLTVLPTVPAWLVRGMIAPADGVGVGLWLVWHVGAVLAMAAVLGVVAYLIRPAGPSEHAHPVNAWIAVTAAAAVALAGLAVWSPAGWPAWFPWLWLPALLFAVQPAPARRQAPVIAAVAGMIAALAVWGAVQHGRIRLAESDAARLGPSGGDAVVVGLLDQFGVELAGQPVPRSAAELYSRWDRSALAADNYPTVLASWSADGALRARLDLAELDIPVALLHALAVSAAGAGVPIIEPLARVPGPHYVLAVPGGDGGIVTVGVGPRSRLIAPSRAAQLLRAAAQAAPPYVMTLSEPRGGAVSATLHWQRNGSLVHGEQRLEFPGGTRHLHVDISVGDATHILTRGALVVLLDGLVVALLWLAGLALAGRASGASLRAHLGLPSYRTRLTWVLAVFFVVPTVGFAAWTAGRLSAESANARDLVIQQTLRDATRTARDLVTGPPEMAAQGLSDLSARLGADLDLYQGAVLAVASTPVLEQLGLVDHYLVPDAYRALALDDRLEVPEDGRVAGHEVRVGYQTVGMFSDGPAVLAAPRLMADPAAAPARADLAYGLLLATLLGLAAAWGFAALAARALARPVQTLRAAALHVGRGEAIAPFASGMPAEFVPVADAFGRMALDVQAGRDAVEAARRRMELVLRNVATGVIALDAAQRVTLANPRAVALVGGLVAGQALPREAAPDWMPLWDWVTAFLSSDDESAALEMTLGERRIHVQAARLPGGQGGVVALDDATELAQAVRVLAWGELARQIAHEIKNPLTPIRLGMQHLQRAHRDRKPDFDALLDRTGRQILAEIERLDAIARAFARFGAPPAEAGPMEPVDLGAVATEAAQLYALGGETAVTVEATDKAVGTLRRDELREVLVNLVENARDAGATEVRIAVHAGEGGQPWLAVRDNGRGIPSNDLPRIFEPRFSTTTSGTGLGLAICRRLVESWGGTIRVTSEVGRGTTVTIDLADQPPHGGARSPRGG